MFSASGLGVAPYKPASGGGPTTTPSFIATGAGVNAASDPNPSYPANASGDLFIARVYANGGTVSGAAGWTQRGTVSDGVVSIYVYTRDARATGSDSGAVTFTASGGTFHAAIDCIRNVATSSFVESVVTATSASNSINMPTVTAGGNARFAYAAIGANNGLDGMASATGETGGDWVELSAEQTSGLGPGCQAQGAPLSSGGSISGGSASIGASSTRGVCVAFALVGV